MQASTGVGWLDRPPDGEAWTPDAPGCGWRMSNATGVLWVSGAGFPLHGARKTRVCAMRRPSSHLWGPLIGEADAIVVGVAGENDSPLV